MIDAKSVFGILADGSDETAKIAAALAAGGDTGTGDEVYFGPGIYGVNDLPAIDYLVSFRGAGINKTIFKNLSPTARMFDFVGVAGADWNTAFARVGGFTVDQNGCTGDGIRMNAMFSGLYDVWAKGQAGVGWAVKATNLTQGKLDNVHISTSTNGLLLDTCYYPRLDNCSVERTTGVAVRMVNCASINIDTLYLDHGPASTIGSRSSDLMQIENCTTVNVAGLCAEISTGSDMYLSRYCHIKNSANVNFIGGRFNHYAVESASYMFYCEGSSVTFKGFEWYSNQNGMIFVGCTANNENLSVEDMRTNLSGPGNRYGVACFDGKSRRVSIKNWLDRGQLCLGHVLDSYNTYCEQVTSPVTVNPPTSGAQRTTLFNCEHGVSGGGIAGAYIVNC